MDWDQRRIYTVVMDEEQEEETLAIEGLDKYIATLGRDVLSIHLSATLELLSSSSDPNKDQTIIVFYPPVEELQFSGEVQTILRTDLREVRRIAGNVDLVEYSPSFNSTEMKRVIFKYYILGAYMDRFWHELNLWIRLPKHPNIVPFDRVVVDERKGNIVGFTNLFIPGGTLADNVSRLFKLEHLKQLMGVVDDLNLKYGIMHHDVAPRNIVIDDTTDAIMLFDFNFAFRIDDPTWDEDRDDVKGVVFTLYEVITRDKRFDAVFYKDKHQDDILGMGEWVQHPDVRLDNPVSEYRALLDTWIEARHSGKQISHYTDAPEHFDWPDDPEPTGPELEYFGYFDEIHCKKRRAVRRCDLKAAGREYLGWERPMQLAIDNTRTLLASGKYEDEDNDGVENQAVLKCGPS